jgi:hypothetical protein
MPVTDEPYYFEDIPDLDADGRTGPYYREVTVSKDLKTQNQENLY